MNCIQLKINEFEKRTQYTIENLINFSYAIVLITLQQISFGHDPAKFPSQKKATIQRWTQIPFYL